MKLKINTKAVISAILNIIHIVFLLIIVLCMLMCYALTPYQGFDLSAKVPDYDKIDVYRILGLLNVFINGIASGVYFKRKKGYFVVHLALAVITLTYVVWLMVSF